MNIFKFIVSIAVLSLLTGCAKQSTPMGGPRDETPPKLLESNPKDQSLSVKPEELVLSFDEYIKLENPTKGIVITPRIETDKVEFTALKNQVKVKLNQDLEENTTYVFDFQNSVVDISEENPAENLKLVFSTGTTIDSLAVSGKVNFYYPKSNQTFKDVLIGLYPVGDTTDLFTGQPYYLGRVDTVGNFKINNVKNGDYQIFAWNDANGNLKADYKSEEWDFLKDTLFIQQNQEGIRFNLAGADQTAIKVTRSSAFGKNYDIILNRNPIWQQISTDSSQLNFFYTSSDKRIRIYPDRIPKDSIPFNLLLQDSVGNKIDTLIWGKFEESERKPEALSISVNSGKSFYQDLEMKLTFNKPVKSINTDSLFVQYDSAGIIPIRPENLFFEDSAKRTQMIIKLVIPDSLPQTIFTLRASDSTFIDVEALPNSEKIQANYKKLKRTELADEIKGSIELANAPFIIQLLDSKNEIARQIQLTDGNEFAFRLVEPGNYKIRVIEDLNGNGRWDPANFSEKRNAERVFYYRGGEPQTDQITIRAGWTLEDQTITSNPKTGIIPPTN